MVEVALFAVKFSKLMHYKINLPRLTQYGSYAIMCT